MMTFLIKMKFNSLLAGFFIVLFSMVVGVSAFASPGGDKSPVQKESVYKPVVNVVVAVATLNVFQSSFNLPEGVFSKKVDVVTPLKSEKEAVFNSLLVSANYIDPGNYLNRFKAALHNRNWQRTKRSDKILLYVAPSVRVTGLV